MKTIKRKIQVLLFILVLLLPSGAMATGVSKEETKQPVVGTVSVDFKKEGTIVTIDDVEYSPALNEIDMEQDTVVTATLPEASEYRFEDQELTKKFTVKKDEWNTEAKTQTIELVVEDKLPEPDPHKGKLTVEFQVNGKTVSPSWSRIFLNGYELKAQDVDTTIVNTVKINLREEGDFRFKGEQPEANSSGIVSKEFLVKQEDWPEEGPYEYKLIVELETVGRIWFTYQFPKNGGADLFLDGNKIPVGGELLERGKKYEITSTKANATLIADPLKEKENRFLIEEDGKFYFDATKEENAGRIYLAFRRTIEPYYTSLQSEVGKGEIALKLKDSMENLGISKLFTIYKGKVSSGGIDQLIDNVVLILLPENLQKIGDKVEIFALMNDGTYTQVSEIIAGYKSMPIEVSEFYVGDKEIKGKTDPKAEVILTQGTEGVRAEADAEGNFTINLKKALVKDEVFTIYSISGDKRSVDLRLKAEKVKDPVKTAERLSGSNRNMTAVEISKELFKTASDLESKIVIIANGNKEVDALAAGPLSIKTEAPILLVNADEIPSEVLTELQRLAPTKAIIVGGETSVSKNVENVLLGLKMTVTRLSGLNRFETSLDVAKYLKENYKIKDIILANGQTLVDALAVSTYAVDNDLAIVLTDSTAVPASVQSYLDADNASKVSIVGGVNSVSKAIETGLGTRFEKRIQGTSRYQTAVALAESTYTGDKAPKGVIFVNAFKEVDALAAALYAYKNEMPILLVEKSLLHASTEEYVVKEKINDLIVVGGINSIDESVIEEFKALETNPKSDQ